MKQLRRPLFIALFTLCYGVVEAQISFVKKNHDFGVIAEDGGVVEQNFTLRNTSSEPIVIVATHSSCGCTKAEFSRRPIMPDSTSVIKVTFNPMNYPGKFARKITIVTNKGALEERLLITGVVTPRQKSVEEQYPIIMGEGVRASVNSHSFGYVEHGKAEQSVFELFNSSKKSVSLAIENPYAELEFYYPATIAPNERVVVNFGCFLPEKSTIYGSLSYSVNMLINGQKGAYPFIINGLAIDFREENANNSAQMIALSENFIKFGAVKCAYARDVRKLEVANSGKKPLVIRKIELSGVGFTASLEGDCTIAPNEKRVIKVELNTSQLPYGAVVERLTIISNDPQRPVYTIKVSAIIEE
jgi:hypothetical protein